MKFFAHIELPKTIQNGLDELLNESYFYRYPIFWQCFTYVFGGFILNDFKDQEYEYLSESSGIPLSEIPNAFNSYNKLFPRSGGWMQGLYKSNIQFHQFFPVLLSGIGANHRRSMYLKEGEELNQLSEKITGQNTMKDLIKWNNLSYDALKKGKT